MEAVTRMVRHRTFLAALVALLLWAGFTILQSLAAEGRIDPRLQQAMAENQYVPRIEVDLSFTPEDFHMNYLQRYGAVAGVQNRSVFLVQVPRDEIETMAKLYWIQSIKLATR